MSNKAKEPSDDPEIGKKPKQVYPKTGTKLLTMPHLPLYQTAAKAAHDWVTLHHKGHRASKVKGAPYVVTAEEKSAMLTAIVFSAASAEAFGNFIGSFKKVTGADDLAERLTPAQKLRLYPVMAGGCEPKKGVITEVERLCKLRNLVVHGKATWTTVGAKPKKGEKHLDHRCAGTLLKTVNNAVLAAAECFDEPAVPVDFLWDVDRIFVGHLRSWPNKVSLGV